MTKQVEITPSRTYATEVNAIRAVEKVFGKDTPSLRWVMMRNEEGRFYPLFIGNSAIQAGAHFHFCVVN